MHGEGADVGVPRSDRLHDIALEKPTAISVQIVGNRDVAHGAVRIIAGEHSGLGAVRLGEFDLRGGRAGEVDDVAGLVDDDDLENSADVANVDVLGRR